MRHKEKLLNLAEFKKGDLFFDLGCGNASLLIYAVQNFPINAVGFENMPKRYNIALNNIKKHNLGNKIELRRDFYKESLFDANVIFDMMPEGEDDLKELYSKKFSNGTKLIKHDLPLIGYLPDKVDYPFYRMSFPLKKAKSRVNWATTVLDKKNRVPKDLWNELYYYQYEKTYSLKELRIFEKLLKLRLKS